MENYRRKVRIGRTTYPSITEAARAHDVHRVTVRNRILSVSAEWRGWKYVHPYAGRMVVRKGKTTVVFLAHHYDTVASASRATGYSTSTIRNWLRHPSHKDCYYRLPTGKKYKG